MGAITVTALKRSPQSGHALKHTSQWLITDVPSDLAVDVGARSFNLHKFPLASQSGRIRKALTQQKEPKVSRIDLSDIPGGADAFELAAKFCYGVSIEITASNVAMLKCAATYLEMTEEIGKDNLDSRTERYITEVVVTNIQNSITVLRQCEYLLPAADDVKLISRCITSIASKACKEELSSGLLKLERNSSIKKMNEKQLTVSTNKSEWWAKGLTGLSISIFQRLLSTLKSKGLKQDTINKIIMHYAHNSLFSIRTSFSSKDRLSEAELQKQKNLFEAIVGLLPAASKTNIIPLGFLSGLLKTCLIVDAISPSRMQLEKRMGMQLHHAVLDDILIPANLDNNKLPRFDTDVAQRIFTIFLNLNEEGKENNRLYDESDSIMDLEHSTMTKVSRLMDDYLTEVAGDPSLSCSKFLALVELLPSHARTLHDGLYRAIDIFLKVHHSIKESERYRLSKIIDCKKLSREASTHAAQNERLPMQMAIQILHHEQMRLRKSIEEDRDSCIGSSHFERLHISNIIGTSAVNSPRDSYASVRRENRELKLELSRMRARISELERDHISMKNALVRQNPENVFASLTKKFSKLNSLFRAKGRQDNRTSRTLFPF
ncbi:BTB/POZ domain-containing protein At1g03010-like [Nymphaea colorata]|nr:BTB/POZ domain-containing protein At1g03010-like [Nymphaea colorata]